MVPDCGAYSWNVPSMQPLLATRLNFSMNRFAMMRPALQPLFEAAIVGRETARAGVGDASKADAVVFYFELSHIYAGSLMEVLTGFFRRQAKWAGKQTGANLNFGFDVNGIGITLAAWAASNNHKHWQEWLSCQTSGKPFSPQQLDSMKPLARIFFDDENVPVTDDSSAAVLNEYSEGKYDILEDRVNAALIEIATK